MTCKHHLLSPESLSLSSIIYIPQTRKGFRFTSSPHLTSPQQRNLQASWSAGEVKTVRPGLDPTNIYQESRQWGPLTALPSDLGWETTEVNQPTNNFNIQAFLIRSR